MLWIDSQGLHPGLSALLLRVQAAERTAVGAQRRPTFRLMRELLGASMRLGVPAQLLAECLGTSRASVRNRATGRDGPMSAELIRQLTDLTPVQLDQLSGGELTRHAAAPDDPTYLTLDVIRALLNTPRRDPRTGDGDAPVQAQASCPLHSRADGYRAPGQPRPGR